MRPATKPAVLQHVRSRLLTLALALTLTLDGLPPPSAHAYEIDNFTGRGDLTTDALPVLDREINRFLDRAARAVNADPQNRCSRALLRMEVARWTRPDPVSVLELWATFTGEIQQKRIGLSESIYAGVGPVESPSMWFAGIGRSLLVNGHIIGTDKLGHFFMQGLEYFKRVHVDGALLENVMKNEHGEDGLWGKPMTGVKSYADMAANYGGYRFWSRLYLGELPYFRCEKNKGWVKEQPFTFADYINDAWDEAINCSDMKPAVAERAQDKLRRMGLQCPVDLARCLALGRLDKSEFYLSPACRLKVNP